MKKIKKERERETEGKEEQKHVKLICELIEGYFHDWVRRDNRFIDFCKMIAKLFETKSTSALWI